MPYICQVAPQMIGLDITTVSAFENSLPHLNNYSDGEGDLVSGPCLVLNIIWMHVCGNTSPLFPPSSKISTTHPPDLNFHIGSLISSTHPGAEYIVTIQVLSLPMHHLNFSLFKDNSSSIF